MKFLALIFLLTSLSAQARQYIQCADQLNSDRAVINLDGENSTLFMTSGVQNSDFNMLKKLYFKSTQDYSHLYHTKPEHYGAIEEIEIPSGVIGRSSRKFIVRLTHKAENSGYEINRRLVCYSSIFKD